MPVWKTCAGAGVSFLEHDFALNGFPELLSTQILAGSAIQLLKHMALKLGGGKVLKKHPVYLSYTDMKTRKKRCLVVEWKSHTEIQFGLDKNSKDAVQNRV